MQEEHTLGMITFVDNVGEMSSIAHRGKEWKYYGDSRNVILNNDEVCVILFVLMFVFL